MSLLVTNCHGYKATGITGWPASPSKTWALGWFKVDGTTAGAYRAIVQVTDDVLDSTHDYFGVSIDGSNVLVSNARTGNVNSTTPDPGNFYFWNGSNQNKWTVAASVIDVASSAADVKCIFGRAAATAIPATTQTATGDIAAFTDTLVDVYVGGDLRKVSGGSGTTNDDPDGIKLAYVAIGHGSVPSQADIQLVIDGKHPADLAGVFEYWDLTSSSSGLVGALTGATLAPYGGAATAAWDGADNPTVSAPTGGGGAQTLTPTLFTNTQTYFSQTVQLAISLTPTLYTNSQTFFAPAIGNSGSLTTQALKNNTGTVLSSEVGVTAYVYDTTTGDLIVKKTGQTTNGSGVMVIGDSLIIVGTLYRIVVVLGSGAEGMDKLTAA